jgi:hypothetical protein
MVCECGKDKNNAAMLDAFTRSYQEETVEQDLLTLPEHLSPPPGFVGFMLRNIYFSV